MTNFHGGVEWPDGTDPFQMGFMAKLQQSGECITQQGLIFLANERYGAGEWATRTEILSEEEGKVIRAMMRLPDDAELIILRGVFEVPAKGLVFTQLGTARKNTLKGFIKWEAYPVEMAATRCVNRATRFAVGAPVSKDELPGGKDDSDVAAEEHAAQADQNGQTQTDPEFNGQWMFEKETKQIVTLGLFADKANRESALRDYLLNVLFAKKERTDEQLLMAREVMETNLDMIASTLSGENLDAVTARFTELKLHTIGDEKESVA